MAKKSNEEEEFSAASVLGRIMTNKDNKAMHYNQKNELESYLISTGSIKFDLALGGGLNGAACHRFTGHSSSGKTSCILENMYHFFKDCPKGEKRMGFFVKAEGRLSDGIKKRSGIKFVDEYDDWEDKTCFVLKSNIYEFVTQTIIDLVKSLQGQNIKLYIALDSSDGLVTHGDFMKSMHENTQVASGAGIATLFLRKVSLMIGELGHILCITSQVRDNVKIDQRTKMPIKLSSSSGGNALYHFPDWIFEFMKFNDNFNSSSNDDIIKKFPSQAYHPKKNPVIGHWCRVIIRKSNNENRGLEIRYPIKHNVTSGSSVWIEQEIYELLVDFNLVELKGSWIRFDKEIEDKIRELDPEKWEDKEVKIQGRDQFFDYINKNKDICDFFVTYIKEKAFMEGIASPEIEMVEEDEV